MTTELALTESRSLRQQYADRTDVLDRVKALSLLPDDMHATTEGVATYYEVPVATIESTVRLHTEELEENGRRVLKGAELREFETLLGNAANLGLHPNTRSLAIFSRKAILNVGQLLRESDVARRVRTYLLDVEERATPEMRHEAIISRAKGQAEVLRVLNGIVDGRWLEAKAREVAARALGEEPEHDPSTRPLTVSDYLGEQGLTASATRRAAPTFGKRLKAEFVRRHGEIPRTAPRFVDGAQRDVAVYTEADRDLFDAVWSSFPS